MQYAHALQPTANEIEAKFKVYGVLENITRLFRKYENVYVYETNKQTGDSYCVCLNPFDYIPSLGIDNIKAGADFKINTIPNKKNGFGLHLKVKSIELMVPEMKMHREVAIKGDEAHVFRENSRWVVIIGTNVENYSEVRAQIDRCLDAAQSPKKAKLYESGLSM